MAIVAVFGLKDAFSALGFAGFLEVTNRVKKREKIRGTVNADVGNRNLLLTHGLPHDGSVIPHAAGDAGGGVIPVEALAQVGSLVSTLALDGMAIDAELRPEEFRAAASVGCRPGCEEAYGNAKGREQGKTIHKQGSPTHSK